MVTSIARGARAHEPRTPLEQLSTGPDARSVLAQRGDALEELLYTAITPELSARLRMVGAIEHPSVRHVIAVEPELVVLPGDRDRTLADLLTDDCHLSRVTKIFRQLAEALAAVHRAGMCHGLLQPAAVRVTADDQPTIELTGLRLRPSDPRCTAPEAGEPDAASDMYAFGAMLALFVATRAPSPRLRALIDQLLATDPDERLTSIETMYRLASPTRPGTETVRDLDEVKPRELRPAPGLRLGRFELAQQLGVGSTGEVWSAHDRANGPDVAIKLLKPEIAKDPDLLRRFRKEARVLGMVGSPYVTNVIDLNEDRGLHYIVLELVAGSTVASMVDRLGTLPEQLALAIAADACRALEQPHRLGIVHRDVKPDNLMFVAADPDLANLTTQLVKLGDFGISRLVEPASSEPGTREGVLLGTPEYMAPEQCQNIPVTPATDVYALGCSLFTMIAGRPPFEALVGGHVAVILRLVSETPPTLASIAPSVSPAVSALVERCLAKDPKARPSDAAQLLAAIDQIRFGANVIVQAHPAPPVVDALAVRTHAFAYDLQSSPEQLWPHISNTEKMNRAAGLASVKFEIDAEQMTGHQIVAGISLRWKEHPFEWVEGTRHTVLRVFDEGPLRWYTAEVTLERLPNGGTRLHNVVTVEPRRFLFRMISWFQMSVLYKRRLERVYRRLDGILAATPVFAIDPLEPEVALHADARARLEKARLELATVVPERAADAVIGYLQKASDIDVARIRPLALAAALNIPEPELVDASLHAARLGLVNMVWDVICPSCRIPSTVVDSLQKIEEHAHCKACNLDYRVDFSRAIELAFRAAPAIRDVETETFCIGGPGNFPHVVAQIRLQPNERFALSLALAPGFYVVRCPQLVGEHELRVVATGGVRRVDLDLGSPATVPALTAGDQLLTFASKEPFETVVRVERAGERAFALTAARVMANATFRALFPDQQLGPGRLMAITHTTLLVAGIDNASAMFKQLGDHKAFPIAAQFFDLVARLSADHGGSIVKTFGGMVIAAFDRPTAAVDTALALQRESLQPCAIAVHGGPMMALSQAGRLDYFGQNVERAIDALPTTAAGTIGLTDIIYGDVGVAERLADTSDRLGLTAMPDGGWIQHVRARSLDLRE